MAIFQVFTGWTATLNWLACNAIPDRLLPREGTQTPNSLCLGHLKDLEQIRRIYERPLKCVTAALLVLFGFALLAASVHAQSTFVYTNNNDATNSVTAFSVGPGGTLTMVPGSPFLTGGDGSGSFDASNTATVTIRKRILYVSNNGTNDISGFSINTTTGALTPVPGSPFATADRALFLAFRWQ